MDDPHKLPDHPAIPAPLPAAAVAADHPPSWMIGLSGLAAVASIAFTILLYLNR